MLALEEVGTESRARLGGPLRARADLHLDFRRDSLTGQTVLAGSIQQPPLRVIRAFPLEGGAVLTHVHNVSGGILGGDCLRMSVRVGAGASVQLTTTGATRVYRPRREAPETVQESEFSVDEGALLEYVPDALIPFANVRFTQRTSIQLSQGAGLFWWEIVAPGREARGEIFQYDCLQLQTDIKTGGRSIAAEHLRIEPKLREVSSPGRLGPYRYFATFYICRVGLSPCDLRDVDLQLRELAARLTERGLTLWGVSALVAEGLAVRCLAVHGCDVLPGLYAFWTTAKKMLYGCEPIPPRKVH